MDQICKEVFKGIHEGKWLSISYENRSGEISKYWIGIKRFNPATGILLVDGLHLNTMEVKQLNIHIESIRTASVVEGTYCSVNQWLIDDIATRPERYEKYFRNTANLKILNYLADCNRLDNTPYQCEYYLLDKFDTDRLIDPPYLLSEEQFRFMVAHFQKRSNQETKHSCFKQLCVNVMSIPTRSGLYVLAYRRLDLDVATRQLRGADQIHICKEFTINGEQRSIRQFLDAEDYLLLDQFEENLEEIKDCITRANPQIAGVDDRPYLMAIGADTLLDLNYEYNGITEMYQEGEVPVPVQAFFGEMIRVPVRRKNYPLALLNHRVNLDQFLAIHNAVKYPLTYVQGPPGTGKTNTIVNTISTAFFNGKTILFASYNNHPIDGVVEQLRKLTYRGKPIPFPVVRLGNNEMVQNALRHIREMYESVREIPIYESSLERKKVTKVEHTQQLTELLERYEKILDLQKRKEALIQMIHDVGDGRMDIQFELTSQAEKINAALDAYGDITTEDAMALVANDDEEFFKYLYYTSAKYIQRLGEPKNQELLEILEMKDPDEQVVSFNRYIADGDNLRKFMRIFPVVATTCISANKLGEPKPYFDLVIIDEASQCNNAVSLVPIIRGSNLMLVGDPQQLSPVILLDEKDNATLREKYHVAEEYDYRLNSIYKTFLACDSVSDEILLRFHYRCHKQIIQFNNLKYYNQRLEILSAVESEHPLLYVDVPAMQEFQKNTAPEEAEQIIDFILKNKDRKIGIITPFVNQKNYINQLLRENHLEHVACGTVHAFQGDEKDIILFSLALTDGTGAKTYQWLKNNKELINVAVSRAREQLVILSNQEVLDRLHSASQGDDDIYELVAYVRSNGTSQVTQKEAQSRALGIKPYSTATEQAFMDSLNHALGNIDRSMNRYTVQKEVAIAHVFQENISCASLFYTGRFDFVVYSKTGRMERPVLAIELDGKEHFTDSVVKQRDRQKEQICRDHGFQLIRIENTYARRYHYIKDILLHFFAGK